jgi:uncharacterized protein YyaL (SSP411 family)
MFHCFDGTARLGGWLGDQVFMGSALLEAHKATGKREFLEQAQALAEFVVGRFKNPAGGYYDLETSGFAYLSFRLTLIEQNGPAASFFLALTDATGDAGWREAALWALNAFKEDVRPYGIHAASYGRALGEYLATPTLRQTQGRLSFLPRKETVSQSDVRPSTSSGRTGK